VEPLTLGIIGGILLGTSAIAGTKSDKSKVKEEVYNGVIASLKDASQIPIPPIDQWVQVQLGDDTYLVSPRYLAPVGIGEAVRVARINNAELPSPALVDAIWQAADLKLSPRPRGDSSKPPSDFTRATMNSPEAHIDQLAIISKQIQDSDNPNYKLLAGTHKDVVMKDGKLGIYGWHQLNGKVIQGFMWGHAHNEDNPDLDWKDYSQGLRLVRKV